MCRSVKNDDEDEAKTEKKSKKGKAKKGKAKKGKAKKGKDAKKTKKPKKSVETTTASE